MTRMLKIQLCFRHASCPRFLRDDLFAGEAGDE